MGINICSYVSWYVPYALPFYVCYILFVLYTHCANLIYPYYSTPSILAFMLAIIFVYLLPLHCHLHPTYSHTRIQPALAPCPLAASSCLSYLHSRACKQSGLFVDGEKKKIKINRKSQTGFAHKRKCRKSPDRSGTKIILMNKISV